MEGSFVSIVEALLYNELMKMEEDKAIRSWWEENTKRRWTTDYWNHTFVENGITYRHPKEKEFKVGFKFESSHWFTNSGREDWENSEITEENRQDFLELYRNDAYPSEFRVKV